MTGTRWLALGAATTLVTACGVGEDVAEVDGSAAAQDAATADADTGTASSTEEEGAGVVEDDLGG